MLYHIMIYLTLPLFFSVFFSLTLCHSHSLTLFLSLSLSLSLSFFLPLSLSFSLSLSLSIYLIFFEFICSYLFRRCTLLYACLAFLIYPLTPLRVMTKLTCLFLYRYHTLHFIILCNIIIFYFVA